MVLRDYKAFWAICLLASSLSLVAGCDGGADAPVEPADNSAPTRSNDLAAGGNLHAGNRVEDRIAVPEWFPSDIYLPEDFQATQAVDIASPNFTLRGTSSLSKDELLQTHRTQLAKNGYNVSSPEQMDIHEPVIVFGGNGLAGGTIRIHDDGDRREIQINFTRTKVP